MRRLTKRTESLLVCAFLSAWLCCCGSGGSTTANNASSSPGSCNFQTGGDCTIVVNGVTRQYVLHRPTTYSPGSSALVIALHGSRSSGSEFEQGSQLDSKSDQVGFAIAYPTALLDSQGHTAWNGYFSDATFSGTPPDDVSFLRALINTLQANIQPDAKKIFITGFSLGALMTHRAAVELSDLVAAAAPYEFTMYGFSPPTLGGTIPNASTPISILMISGTHTSGPNFCGFNDGAGNVLASMDENVQYWTGGTVLGGHSANSSCSFDTVAPFCNGKPSNNNQSTLTGLDEKNASCGGGATVQVYQLHGGQHQWYGTTTFQTSNCTNTSSPPCNSHFNSTTGTNLNDIIWNFFAGHPKP